MRKLLFPLLLPLLLFSCAKPEAGVNESAFPRTDDPDLPYVHRNGDNYAKSGLAYSYAEQTVEATLSDLVRRIESKETVCLFLHQDTCASCKAAHDDLTHFFIGSGLLVHGVHFEEDTRQERLSMLNTLLDVYPEYAKTIKNGGYHTPTFFLLRDQTHATPVSFLDQRDSLEQMETFFRGLMNLTFVYEFTSYDAFVSFSKDHDCVAYMDDGSDFFSESIRPKAIHSSAHTARIRKADLLEKDRAAFETYFGEEKDLLLVEKGQASRRFDTKKDAAGATSFLTSYYA